MSKTMCDLAKSESKSDCKKAKRWAEQAQYVCQKCGRLAAKKKRLCKAAKLRATS